MALLRTPSSGLKKSISPIAQLRGGKKAEKPVATAEETALQRRQESLLNKEIEEEEERLKAGARGKLGFKSLLSGAAPTVSAAASGGARGGAGASGGASLLGGAPGRFAGGGEGARRFRP